MAFCASCGEELIEGDSFCRSCGAAIGPLVEEAEVPRDSGCEEPGMPKKCPACGEYLFSGERVCPACGYEIAKLAASRAIDEFVKRLNEAEARASNGSASYKAVVGQIDRASIPHTVDGALSFLSVAEGRVCGSARDYGQGLEARKAVLQAWSAKARQVYDVAKLSFSADPEFSEIERSYRKISSSAGLKGTMDGLATVNESLLSKGCLGKIIWFFIVMTLLAVLIGIVGSVKSKTWPYCLVLVVIAVLWYRHKKNGDGD